MHPPFFWVFTPVQVTTHRSPRRFWSVLHPPPPPAPVLRQAWPWRPALYFARLVLAALPAPRTDADRAVAAPAAPTGPGAALRGAELRWLSGRLGVVGLLVPPSALNRAPHMKQIPKVVLNRQEQHSAFSECVAVLESNQVQYFPSRGTLIGLVRYGDLQGKLSGFKVDVVDRDMDWMVHVDSADSWFHLAQQISASLLDKGWHSCQLTVASEVLCLGEIHSMKCIRIEPYVASVDFDAYHLLPGRLCLGFRDEQLSSPYRRCAETAETAVDRGAETGAAGAARRCFGAQEVFPLQKCRAPVVGSVPLTFRTRRFLCSTPSDWVGGCFDPEEVCFLGRCSLFKDADTNVTLSFEPKKSSSSRQYRDFLNWHSLKASCLHLPELLMSQKKQPPHHCSDSLYSRLPLPHRSIQWTLHSGRHMRPTPNRSPVLLGIVDFFFGKETTIPLGLVKTTRLLGIVDLSRHGTFLTRPTPPLQVPCPRDPVAYLAQLYDAETSAALTASRARRCWALPSITESRAPNDPRNQLLRQQGLNGSDVALLRRDMARWETGDRCPKNGAASFSALLQELEYIVISRNIILDLPTPTYILA